MSNKNTSMSFRLSVEERELIERAIEKKGNELPGNHSNASVMRQILVAAAQQILEAPKEDQLDFFQGKAA